VKGYIHTSNGVCNSKRFLNLVVPIAGILCCAALVMLSLPFLASAQDTGSISGTVTDNSGAAVVGAEVTVSDLGGSLTRATVANADGVYVAAGLPGGTYNITVVAKGFQKYQAKSVVLQVAQKARVDVTLAVGTVNEEIVVLGENVAQVDTQSAELGGTVTGKQITQLQLNGRNFVQLATTVPGVSNQTNQDEGTVGVNGNVAFSFNGGRTEYNNWELDGGDNMDNGSNASLNVYPSIDAIAEVKVLTSNYGAQYGRNASGTVEVETKSGTNKFHGDVYYFGRNDFFNARNFFDPPGSVPKFKKHDFGYTIGGPVFIPNHYNANKQKTFFFFSEEWRRDLVPGQSFLTGVPSVAERGGDFSDVCPNLNVPSGTDPLIDCPTDPRTGAKFDGSLGPVAVDPNAQAILAEIPTPNAPGSLCGGGVVACFNSSPAQATKWREELVRVDHNFSSNERLTFRYIHDSWQTVTATTLWGCPDGSNGCSFPTIQTNFVGPGTSTVVRLTSTLTPSLLNEFVASYTADHIFLTNTGPGAVARPASMTMTGLFPNFGGKLPGFLVSGNSTAYGGSFTEDPYDVPWNNANPTYTFRDNMTKVIRTHTLQFGAYVAIAQKNEQSSFGDVQGYLKFDASNSNVSSGNAFADLLIGNISEFQQVNLAPKYYFRYQIVEPYLQDDWRITPRLTLNLGVRVSLFGTYREKYNQTYNFEPSVYNLANAPAISGTDGSLIDPTTSAQLDFTDPRVYNGIVQCGGKTPGVPRGCVHSHLFNPAPRIGFAWDPWGNGRTSIRGGYGIFFEHGNGNEQNVEALEATAPLVLNPTQPNIIGYTNIGGGGGTVEAFPLGFNSIATRGVWPYVQQWNVSVEHEMPQHIVTSVAYVGSKGTHLGQRREFNQLQSLPLANNPYLAGEAIGPNDCTTGTTPSGAAITGQAAINLAIACGGDPNPNRPYLGFGAINGLAFAANSSYNAFQFAARRAIAPLTLSVAYTYSHSIDNGSDGGAFVTSSPFVDAYNYSSARASSNFDQRHMLNISYVYDLPFFRRQTGLTHTLLGGWQFAGLTAIQTGTPFSVTFGTFGDNAGVGNGQGPGTYGDLIGDPHSSVPASTSGPGPLLFNPNAFAAPRGLTFGNAGRNILHNPRTTNFDMSLLKDFTFNESTRVEFRAEAFNIFNHTQWNGVDNDISSGTFLHPSGAHRARTMQFGLKFLF
jgi:hypothetical protein